ncbi:hypothetical protein ACFOYW_07895 [Gryllotalpicola reticulitermitis]|uniref:Mannosyl-glycoprotein endo-beta-N-acetylglucosaminidase n=1 Tax=Gryllotalpicola reticulitermitis TaxID=1184153 RepID=A0ABV8Q809_9MICO
MRRLITVLVVACAVLIAAAVGIPAIVTLSAQAKAALNPCPKVQPVAVGDMTVPRGPIAGFCQAQLVNAAEIMRAAQARGIGTHTQAVGVMTAIGESKLRNLSYGDTAGPDSRGIFQQRDNGAWGTLADRMDPYTASVNFYAKLTSIPGWRTMQPSELAHEVQANADAGYYSKYWSRAQQVVAALTPTSSATPAAPSTTP